MLLLACATSIAPGVEAQPYPSRLVKIVVPFDVGGPNDLIARVIAEPLGKRLGQPVIVENKPGAAAAIGIDYVVKSPADGYTLLMSGAPTLTNKLPFDLERDLAPVTLLSDSPLILTVRAESKATSLKDFVALARSQPGKMSFGSSGAGSPSHLAGELFNQVAGTDAVHVAYKGQAPGTTALLGGQVDFMFTNPATLLPLAKAGKLRPLGPSGKRRFSALPDVPTMVESGYPAFEWTVWIGVFAPAGTPPPIVTRLNRELVAIAQTSEARERFANIGVDPVGSSPEEFGQTIRRDIAMWSGLIRKLGLAPQN